MTQLCHNTQHVASTNTKLIKVEAHDGPDCSPGDPELLNEQKNTNAEYFVFYVFVHRDEYFFEGLLKHTVMSAIVGNRL